MADRQRVGTPVAIKAIPVMLLAGACSFPVFAQTELTFGLDSRFTDNARKADANEDSDIETRAYLTAGYQTDPGRCNADFQGTLGYSWWQDDSFDSESFAEMDFQGDCELANGGVWPLKKRRKK